MRKMIILILFLSVLKISYSQPAVPGSSSSSTVVDQRKMIALNLFIPRYRDTTAANAAKGIDSSGALIFVNNSLYYRASSPKRWILFASTSGSYWDLEGNSGTDSTINFIGTIDDVPLLFKTSNHLNGYLGYNDGNVLFGGGTMQPIGGADKNVGIGWQALHSGVSSFDNVAVGDGALYLTADGGRNIAIGTDALRANVSGGDNVAIGSYAGKYTADPGNKVIFNTIDQGNAAGDSTKSLTWWSQDANPVLSRLRFNGYPQFVDGTQGTGKILSSDANGNGHWVSSSSIAPGLNTVTGIDSTSSHSISITATDQAGASPGINVVASSEYEGHSSYANGLILYTHSNTSYRAPYINLFRSRGTQASPTAVQVSTYETGSIGGIEFGGYDGTSYYGGATGVTSEPDENWTPTRHGAHMSLYYTARGNPLSQQMAQFGGRDASNDTTITDHIIFYRPLAFTGNNSASPIIDYTTSPARFIFRTANTGGGKIPISLASIDMFGSSSGQITIQPQAASGTYNWNWPTSAGISGYVLISGGGSTSPMTWVPQSSIVTNAWSLTGNSGLTPVTNFIGTTDSVPFAIRAFNIQSGGISVANSSTNFGYYSMQANTGIENTAFGRSAMYTGPSGSYNTGIGAYSLYSNTSGQQNTATGDHSLTFNTTGSSNAAFGVSTLSTNTTGSFNSAFGSGSQVHGTTGSNNTTLGYHTQHYNTTGSNNTSLGYFAAELLNGGVGNVNLGYYAGHYNVSDSNRFFLDNKDETNYDGDSTRALAYGIFNSTYTNQRLKINGRLQVRDGTQSIGYVLTSDANGIGHWAAASGGTPSLTATQIAFGDGSNLMTSSSDFIFDGTNFVASANGNIQPQSGGSFDLVVSPSNKVRVDRATGLIKLGDVDNNNNSDVLTVDEASSMIYYDNGGFSPHSGKFGINTSTPSGNLEVKYNGEQQLLIDGVSRSYKIGDVDAGGNGSFIDINDAGNKIILQNSPQTLFVGINTSTPSVALESLGDLLIKTSDYLGGLISATNANGQVIIGDVAGMVGNTNITVSDGPGAVVVNGQSSITNNALLFTVNSSNTNIITNAITNIGDTVSGNYISIHGNSAISDANNMYYFSSGSNIFQTGAVTINNLSGTGTRGVVANSSGLLSAGNPIATIVASADSTAKTATDTNVTSFTVSGSDGSFIVSASLDITSVAAGVLTTTVNWTDIHSNSRTGTFYGMGTTTAGIGALGSSNFAPMGEIRAKAGTTITVVETLTVGTATYDISATIQQLR